MPPRRAAQHRAARRNNALNVCVVKMPAQNKTDGRLELRPDVRTLEVVKPVERMVHQGHSDMGGELPKLVNRSAQAAAADPKLGVILIILAKQRAVQRQDANLHSPNVDRFDGAAG